MSLVDTIFLAVVVVAFAGYGAVLFTVWLALEVLGKPKSAASSPAPKADRPFKVV